MVCSIATVGDLNQDGPCNNPSSPPGCCSMHWDPAAPTEEEPFGLVWLGTANEGQNMREKRQKPPVLPCTAAQARGFAVPRWELAQKAFSPKKEQVGQRPSPPQQKAALPWGGV